MFNEVLYLTMAKEVDSKNFCKVADQRVKNVKWTEKLTDAEILNLPNKIPKLLTDIKRRKRKRLRHISRHECVLRTVFKRRMKDV